MLKEFRDEETLPTLYETTDQFLQTTPLLTALSDPVSLLKNPLELAQLTQKLARKSQAFADLGVLLHAMGRETERTDMLKTRLEKVLSAKIRAEEDAEKASGLKMPGFMTAEEIASRNRAEKTEKFRGRG